MKVPPFVIRKRKRIGWTQADIARLLDVNTATVMKLEGNCLSVRGETLARYLSLLGYSLKILP